MLAVVVSWLLHAQDPAPGVTLPLHTWEFGLQFYSWCWKSTLCCEPHPGSCTDHCSTSWSVWFAWVSLSLVNWAGILFSFPSSLKQGRWWSLLFLFYWFTLWLTNFWPYQCIFLLTLTLHFRGQALFKATNAGWTSKTLVAKIMWISESCISGCPLF